MYILLWFLELT